MRIKMNIRDLKIEDLKDIKSEKTLINCGFQATNIGKAIS